MKIRRSKERGHADHGWLQSFHTFSFADYFDREHMGFRALRVINEDFVAAAQGFGTHPHRDMEIVTYILEGELEHRDSMGNGSVIRVGDVQYMSAGTGVTHSEMNPSKDQSCHLLQIWLLPDKPRYEPRYDQKHFPREEKLGKLRLVVSPDGADGSIAVRQDVRLLTSFLDKSGAKVSYPLKSGRAAWIQVARGELQCSGELLKQGDAAAVGPLAGESSTLEFEAAAPNTEFLLFDLA